MATLPTAGTSDDRNGLLLLLPQLPGWRAAAAAAGFRGVDAAAGARAAGARASAAAADNGSATGGPSPLLHSGCCLLTCAVPPAVGARAAALLGRCFPGELPGLCLLCRWGCMTQLQVQVHRVLVLIT